MLNRWFISGRSGNHVEVPVKSPAPSWTPVGPECTDSKVLDSIDRGMPPIWVEKGTLGLLIVTTPPDSVTVG